MLHDLTGRFKRALFPFAALAIVTLSFVNSGHAVTGGLSGKPDSGAPFSAIYVIGDSLSDTGRTAAAFAQMGVPFPPTRNGALWIEYFAPAVRLTYDPLDNFAWAGATTGEANAYALPMAGMLNQAVELRDLAQRALDPSALYVVFGGTNDFLQINLATMANAASVIDTSTTNLANIAYGLYHFGARNIVVVNVADLGRTPFARTLGPQIPPLATQFSAAFNTLLDQKLSLLGFPIATVNLFDLSRDFTDKPKKYGFTNVTDQSFPDLAKSDTYLFWDQLHPTTRAHRYLADEIYRVVSKAGMFKGKLK